MKSSFTQSTAERAGYMDLLGPQRLALAGLLLTLLFLPFRAYYEVGLLLCLIAAGWSVQRGYRPLQSPGLRLFLIAYGAYVLAALLALPDAVDSSASLRSTLSALRYIGYGWAACLLERAQLHRLLRAAALILSLWVLDALVQASFGVSLGGRNLADRVSGIFGDADLKLGPVLGVLAALLLAALRTQRIWLQASVVLLIVVAVLVAGARAGWVSLAVVLLCWIALQVHAHGKRLLPVLALSAAGSALLSGALYFADAQFAGRVDRTLLLVQGDRAAVDTALAFRLPIWETAVRMAWAHPVNGVGVRGFRDAYPRYASADDRWVQQRADRSSGANHPHQLVLEVWCETGLIGLLLWVLAAWLLLRRWVEADVGQRVLAWGPAIALLAMCFPINTHLAFYSSFWGSLLFWLLALYCATISLRPAPAQLNAPTATD